MAEATAGDQTNESKEKIQDNLRPSSFDDYIGQAKLLHLVELHLTSHERSTWSRVHLLGLKPRDGAERRAALVSLEQYWQ